MATVTASGILQILDSPAEPPAPPDEPAPEELPALDRAAKSIEDALARMPQPEHEAIDNGAASPEALREELERVNARIAAIEKRKGELGDQWEAYFDELRDAWLAYYIDLDCSEPDAEPRKVQASDFHMIEQEVALLYGARDEWQRLGLTEADRDRITKRIRLRESQLSAVMPFGTDGGRQDNQGQRPLTYCAAAQDWEPVPAKRPQGYGLERDKTIAAMHKDGEPAPTAVRILEIWRDHTPPGFTIGARYFTYPSNGAQPEVKVDVDALSRNIKKYFRYTN